VRDLLVGWDVEGDQLSAHALLGLEALQGLSKLVPAPCLVHPGRLFSLCHICVPSRCSFPGVLYHSACRGIKPRAICKDRRVYLLLSAVSTVERGKPAWFPCMGPQGLPICVRDD